MVCGDLLFSYRSLPVADGLDLWYTGTVELFFGVNTNLDYDYHMMYHEFFIDIRKLMKNVALIGAYGEEYKSLRTTFVIGLIITALTIIPLLSFLLWP